MKHKKGTKEDETDLNCLCNKVIPIEETATGRAKDQKLQTFRDGLGWLESLIARIQLNVAAKGLDESISDTIDEGILGEEL